MSWKPKPGVFPTPDKPALLFATKGVIAMVLALAVATFLDLERPYWALIGAVFLQTRPETGMVIEKGACQIAGTLVGGAVGVAMLFVWMPHPAVVIALLALWVGMNAAASAMVRRLNLIYGFAVAGVTAVLVVVLTMVGSAAGGSETVVDIATARMSEIVVGAVCATLAATLLWPRRVKHVLKDQARDAINETLEYMDLELVSDSTHEQRELKADAALQPLLTLNDDSSAAVFEGRAGLGRARAVTRLCQKLLSLLALIQVFGRFRRYHADLISGELDGLFESLREGLQQMRRTGSEDEARGTAQRLRRQLQQTADQCVGATPLQRRLAQMLRQLTDDLVVALQAHHALDHSDQTLLRARSLAPYRDPLIGAITAFRSTLVFALGAVVWFVTGSSAAVALMVLPVIFSIVIAAFPSPPQAMRRLLVGAIAAVPVAFLFGWLVLAPGRPDFELLVAIFCVPLFIALLVIADLDKRAYGLGFAITYILLIQPASPMTFTMAGFGDTALAIVAAIAIVYAVFRLVTTPGARLMRRRLIASTSRDLRHLGQPDQRHGEEWFNARMAERLLRLSAYDRALPAGQRHLTDLGLTGLNFGHTCLRLQRQIKAADKVTVRHLTRQWQQALAEAYYRSSKGETSDDFRQCSVRLLDALRQSAAIDAARIELIEGMMERLALTLERTAENIAHANEARMAPPKTRATASQAKGA